MKKLMLPLAIIAGIIVADGCRNHSTDPKEVAEDNNAAKFRSRASERDAQFVVDAYSSGLEEIRMSEDAKAYAYTSDVKNFAGNMISAHTGLNEKLEALAAGKQISIAKDLTKDQLDKIAALNNKKGKEYDEAYLDKVIDAHKDAISLFEKASTDATDEEIRAVFNSALPELRNHLDMATAARDHLRQ